MNDSKVYVTNIVTIAGTDYRIVGKDKQSGQYIGINVLMGINYRISATLIRYAELFA